MLYHTMVSKKHSQFYAILILRLFLAINKGDIKDTEMDSIINSIVDSLFSVFVTLGSYNYFYVFIASK